MSSYQQYQALIHLRLRSEEITKILRELCAFNHPSIQHERYHLKRLDLFKDIVDDQIQKYRIRP